MAVVVEPEFLLHQMGEVMETPVMLMVVEVVVPQYMFPVAEQELMVPMVQLLLLTHKVLVAQLQRFIALPVAAVIVVAAAARLLG